MHPANILGLAAAAAFSLVATGARAELIERTSFINATGNCNGSLPGFEGALRKRPTGILNEGTTPSFVGCSLAGDEENFGTGGVVATFVNRSGAAATVNCTYVDGVAAELGIGAPQFYPGSVEVPAGGSGPIVWNATSSPFSSYVNLNCALPPGVEINAVGYLYAEDNGVDAP